MPLSPCDNTFTIDESSLEAIAFCQSHRYGFCFVCFLFHVFRFFIFFMVFMFFYGFFICFSQLVLESVQERKPQLTQVENQKVRQNSLNMNTHI